MIFLLDTNVISEGRKPVPDPAVSDWFGAVASVDLRLSVLTIGEIHRGIEKVRRHDPPQAVALTRWLDVVISAYQDRIAPLTSEIAEAWGAMSAARTLPTIDGLLGATALVNGWTLATRNTADLGGTEVKLFDPWSFGLGE